MTVIRPNSLSGITSITVEGSSLAIHDSSHNLIRELVATGGVSTFSAISVGTAGTIQNNGAAAFAGIVTANGGVVVGSAITIQSNGNIAVTGIITASSFSGIDSDKISEGTSQAEIIDTGSDGRFIVTTEGSERLRVGSAGSVGINTTEPESFLHIFKNSATQIPDVEKDVSGDTSAGIGDITLTNKNATSGNFNAISFNTLGDTNTAYVAADMVVSYPDHGGANPSGEIRLRTKNDSGVLRTGVIINSDSQVGIATTVTNAGSILTIDGSVTPSADAAHDLGSISRRWANIFTADLNLSNEGSNNDIDGTWGRYTIQEGEDNLFLINKRTGKKYKFMLEEVN
tara:strand:- start:330 stop:1358 length:1029 start_codon:yes stop_codon:yes gene_type:complete